eukprot:383322-Pyramimonas_sp.AAC.1
MVRRERQTKKLLELVKAHGHEGRWRAHRAQGVIYKASSPVIKLIIPDVSPEPTTFEWNYRVVKDLGLD